MKIMRIAVLLLAAMFLSAAEEPLVIRFVRHGQLGVEGTEFTPADKSAWIGLGLTPQGRKQAEVTGRFLKKENIPLKTVIGGCAEQ